METPCDNLSHRPAARLGLSSSVLGNRRARMNLSIGNRAVLTLAALTLAQGAVACDYCLISQGASPLDTVNGRGLRVTERYTTLDSVYDGSRERANPGASETYYTTEVTGFWDPRPWLTLIAVAPLRVTAVDGHLEHHGGDEPHVDPHRDPSEDLALREVNLYTDAFWRTFPPWPVALISSASMDACCAVAASSLAIR